MVASSKRRRIVSLRSLCVRRARTGAGGVLPAATALLAIKGTYITTGAPVAQGAPAGPCRMRDVRSLATSLVCAAALHRRCSTSGTASSGVDAGVKEVGAPTDAAWYTDAFPPPDATVDAMMGCGPLPDGQAPASVLTDQLASAAFPDAGTPSVAPGAHPPGLRSVQPARRHRLLPWLRELP